LILFFITLVADLERSHGYAIAYYTCWNFILQTVYFAWAIKVSIWRPSTKERRILNGLFDTCFATMFLVASVLWLILYPIYARDNEQDKVLNWVSYVQHGGNIVLFLIEFASNGRIISKSSFAFVTLFATTYAALTWSTHDSLLQGYWPYPMLDVTKPSSPLWYMGILIFHVLFFGFVLLLSKLKKHIINNTMPQDLDLLGSSVLLISETQYGTSYGGV